MKMTKNSAINIIVIIVTMERLRKVVMTIIFCHQNTKNQHLAMKFCPNSAQTMNTQIVIKNIKITLDYGDINKNVKYQQKIQTKL